MRRTLKERKGAGRDSVKEAYAKFKETNKEIDGGKERIKEVKDMRNEMLKSKDKGCS